MRAHIGINAGTEHVPSVTNTAQMVAFRVTARTTNLAAMVADVGKGSTQMSSKVVNRASPPSRTT